MYYLAEKIVQHKHSYTVPHSNDWVLGMHNPNDYDVVVTYTGVRAIPPQEVAPKTVTVTAYKTITDTTTYTEKELETITENKTITEESKSAFVPGFIAPTTLLTLCLLALLGHRRRN